MSWSSPSVEHACEATIADRRHPAGPQARAAESQCALGGVGRRRQRRRRYYLPKRLLTSRPSVPLSCGRGIGQPIRATSWLSNAPGGALRQAGAEARGRTR